MVSPPRELILCAAVEVQHARRRIRQKIAQDGLLRRVALRAPHVNLAHNLAGGQARGDDATAVLEMAMGRAVYASRPASVASLNARAIADADKAAAKRARWEAVPGWLVVTCALADGGALDQLLQTVVLTLPGLVNVGVLLALLFFIYGVMGVQLFATVAFGDGGFDELHPFMDEADCEAAPAVDEPAEVAAAAATIAMPRLLSAPFT